MDYSLEDLLALIERHDEHEDYYRGKLNELVAEAWDDGWRAGSGQRAILRPRFNPYRESEG